MARVLLIITRVFVAWRWNFISYACLARLWLFGGQSRRTGRTNSRKSKLPSIWWTPTVSWLSGQTVSYIPIGIGWPTWPTRMPRKRPVIVCILSFRQRDCKTRFQNVRDLSVGLFDFVQTLRYTNMSYRKSNWKRFSNTEIHPINVPHVVSDTSKHVRIEKTIMKCIDVSNF